MIDEEKIRESLSRPILSVPDEKIKEVFGSAYRDTLILHSSEIDIIIERVNDAIRR